MSTPVTHELGPKERFFRYFQQEVSGTASHNKLQSLQEQMDKIADSSLVGGERTDATDDCLAGIARLADEVKDASPYLPAYDQRTYSETIKALSERFQEIRATIQPKARFSFKTARKNKSVVSPNDVAGESSAHRLKISGHHSDPSSAESSSIATPVPLPLPSNEIDGIERSSDSSLLTPQGGAIRKPSPSGSTAVQISNYNGAHITLRPSASSATSSGSLTSLKRCVVDMSVLTASGEPFAGLALKNICDSLVVCGHVDGPAHVTGVEDSVIVVACRQLRMHDCKGVDVYLLCASRPIIEDCSNIRFAPLPESYVRYCTLITQLLVTDHLIVEQILGSGQPIENQWDRVDDFKWLKAEHSPNWSILPPENRIALRVWTDVVPGGSGVDLDGILNETVLARQ
ncbi:hypothetical protein FGG08_003201 [Glutinoglossum americanum]|uniref:C-CAP/cofactor C-like domain-containing protein n=1 Tax=Glutinoglossum americanum TaxID=1670608 RepID=A0A9P8L4X7_9PEZI|nr:hypothetical protein FGG08_003201 [Glutinoglossum americanum]